MAQDPSNAIRLAFLLLLPGAFALTSVTPAWGQPPDTRTGLSTDSETEENAEDPAELESMVVREIIVTGQKRERTVQESDVSVTAFDRQALTEVRLRDFRRIDDLVPNVQFNESGQLSSVFISIRGVESNPFIVNRAAIYIDGIPFRELNNAVLNQIDSVEVLRGPQATLYGANSEAGLILINSKEPGDSAEGTLRGTFSSFDGGNTSTVDGFVGGPLNDHSLDGSVAFKVSDRDSFFPNPLSSIGEPGEIDELFLQGRMTWRPNDRLTLKAMAYVIDIDAPGIFEEEYLPTDRSLYDASYGFFNGGRGIGRYELLQDSPKRTEERDYVAGISANYLLARGQIDAAVSYTSEDEDSRGNDLDFTALPTAAGGTIFEQEIWNAEVRYTSPASDRFEYLFGASFYEEDETLLVGTLVGPGALSDFQFAPPQTRGARDFALFGTATFGLGVDGLSLSAGLRYDRALRETQQSEGSLNFGPLGDVIFQELAFDETFDNFLPRLALTYRPNPGLTAYASAAKGYIPGGFNLTIAQEAVADDIIRYGNENVWNYELGLKHLFSNGRGYINGALFFIDADDWQEIRVITNDQGQVQSSAFIAADASIESRGFEVEFGYSLSERWTLNANFGYIDAEYTRLIANSLEDLTGNQVKLVPEYDANIALRYAHPNGFFARAELSAIGDTALDERNRFERDAVEVWNLQAGYEGSNWSVRAFLENATDERYQNGLAFDNFAFGLDGNAYSVFDNPRVAGVELEYRL